MRYSKHSHAGGMPMALTDSLKTLLIETAKSLKVSARRDGVSQVWMLCAIEPPKPLAISHVSNSCDIPSRTATPSQGPLRGNGSQSPFARGLCLSRDRKARATGHTKHTATLEASSLLDHTPHPAVSFSWGFQSTGASRLPTFFCLISRCTPCCGWHAICAWCEC